MNDPNVTRQSHDIVNEWFSKNSKIVSKHPILSEIDEMKDIFVQQTFWLLGGDGWAYDIGYGGLDHVLAQDSNIKTLV